MLKYLSEKILSILGWKIDIVLPEEKKFVLIGAPHTSNWDFPFALLTFFTIDLKIFWVAKIQMFKGPLYPLFTSLGGIPVDREATTGFIEQIAERFNQTDEMVLTIAPEGSRSKREYWKSGFYHIALTANVPICLGYIDYKSKKIGFAKVVHPTGDIEADMNIIAEFYSDMKGKQIKNQGPVRVKKKES